jgi:dTDP-4-dehydrorhamnose reductase
MLDDYGFSKSIGDSCKEYGLIIRTSIIGEELENKRSLLEWVKSKKGEEVNGFVNHYWNGVTCLQLAKVLESLLSYSYSPGVLHLFSELVSKAELVQLISEVFNLNVTVLPGAGPEFCDRTLGTNSIAIKVPPLRQQLEELRDFSIL